MWTLSIIVIVIDIIVIVINIIVIIVIGIECFIYVALLQIPISIIFL